MDDRADRAEHGVGQGMLLVALSFWLTAILTHYYVVKLIALAAIGLAELLNSVTEAWCWSARASASSASCVTGERRPIPQTSMPRAGGSG